MKYFVVTTVVFAILLFASCKTEVGGGSLTADPDAQYFPRGPEFKLQEKRQASPGSQPLERD